MQPERGAILEYLSLQTNSYERIVGLKSSGSLSDDMQRECERCSKVYVKQLSIKKKKRNFWYTQYCTQICKNIIFFDRTPPKNIYFLDYLLILENFLLIYSLNKILYNI